MLKGLLGKLGESRLNFWLPHLGISREPTVFELCHRLLDLPGEAAGILIADELIARCSVMDYDEERRFFEGLLHEFQPDQERLIKEAKRYIKNPGAAAASSLSATAEAPRQAIFRLISMSPDGLLPLIRLRERLLKHVREVPELQPVDDDLVHLFRSWFNRGFLELRRIDWTTPAHILEKLIEYEAVHAIRGWDDLRRRLEEDRRCYAFFHPVLEDEPLVFLEVALMQAIPANILEVIDQQSGPLSDSPKAAVFYSISNCQNGLKGVSFGNFLIKQVLQDLEREIPSLQQFATLSPIPGFRKWLKNGAGADAVGTNELAPVLQEPVESLAGELEYHRDALTRLCAQYLAVEKRDASPLDPVARFHLGNGARLERINWLGDTSESGLSNSLGMLVNYRYMHGRLEQNHEAFVNTGEIDMSPQVRRLLKETGRVV